MTHLLSAIFFLFSLSSCADSAKTEETEVKTQRTDTTFVPDNFATRDDTGRFNIDKGNLSGHTMTLDVSFGAISCTCAQWSETKYAEYPGKRIQFYLEPANTSLINADTLFDGNNLPVRVLVAGQFYSKDGYPKDYHPAKGSPDPARVFRYTKIEVEAIR